MRSIILCLLILAGNRLSAQDVNIIPQPSSLAIGSSESTFSLKPTTLLVLEGSGMENAVNFFNDYLYRFYKFRLKTIKTTKSKNCIRLNFERMDGQITGSYKLNVDDDGVYIAGDNEEGVFYGIQTLIQLLPLPENSSLFQLELPHVNISDEPRFAYRGLHLDVSRHFFPVSYIKKYIDFIALYKLNYFHWHLTDDQGWRIEIKKYPRLTSVGGWRAGTIIGRYPGTGNDHIRYGGFYTQEQVKEVVKYAAARYITVIPEIEMPGHSLSALAAYPQLGTNPDSTYKVAETWGVLGVFNNVLSPTEYTFNFLQDVLDEVIPLFPSPYIHIGGDECDKQWWHKSVFCQQLMKQKGIKDEEGLQSYFIQRIEKYVNSKGKKIIGWDEILEGGLAQNAAVMSWRGEQGGIAAAKQKHEVVMSPENPLYLNHSQSENEDSITQGGYNPIENVYAYDPIPKVLSSEEAKFILGAQGNMWAEYYGNTKKLEYMLFPRLSALSEVLWTPKENKNWDDFQKKLPLEFKRYDLWKVNYSKAYFDMTGKPERNQAGNGLMWTVSSRLDKEIRITTDNGQPVHYKTIPGGMAMVNIDKPVTLKATLYDNKKPITSLTQKFNFNKVTGKKITLTTPSSEKYPGDGAFTLVNGIINDKGISRSKEFLGFNGTDCEAIIDMGESTSISYVVVNCLDRTSSWIWRPVTAEVMGSGDGKEWYSLKLTDDAERTPGSEKIKMTMPFRATFVRFLKVIIKNWGEIPEGNPGAGKKPWLFVDEIEVLN